MYILDRKRALYLLGQKNAIYPNGHLDNGNIDKFDLKESFLGLKNSKRAQSNDEYTPPSLKEKLKRNSLGGKKKTKK